MIRTFSGGQRPEVLAEFVEGPLADARGSVTRRESVPRFRAANARERFPGILQVPHLTSALDVVGAGRLPITSGAWALRHEFYAIDFPLLSVLIELTVKTSSEPFATIISQEVG